MTSILKTLSWLGLILTISPAFLHFSGVIGFEQHKWLTLLGTLLYLTTAPFWMNKKKAEKS
jgi:hypothetical protein